MAESQHADTSPILDHVARLAVERTFPGLRCNFVKDWSRLEGAEPEDSDIEIQIVGQASDLLHHGFLVPRMLELMPPCGVRRFGGWACRTLGLPFGAEVARTAAGFRVRDGFPMSSRSARASGLGCLEPIAADLRRPAQSVDRLPTCGWSSTTRNG